MLMQEVTNSCYCAVANMIAKVISGIWWCHSTEFYAFYFVSTGPRKTRWNRNERMYTYAIVMYGAAQTNNAVGTSDAKKSLWLSKEFVDINNVI